VLVPTPNSSTAEAGTGRAEPGIPSAQNDRKVIVNRRKITSSKIDEVIDNMAVEVKNHFGKIPEVICPMLPP